MKDSEALALTANKLRNMPSLSQGHTADLKVDTGTLRVWLSRMTAEDGETRPVQYERFRNGKWVTAHESWQP